MSNYDLVLRRKKAASKVIQNNLPRRMSTTEKSLICHESNGFRLLQDIGESLSVTLQSSEQLSSQKTVK